MIKHTTLLVIALITHTISLYPANNDNAPLGMNLGGLASWEAPVFVDIFKQSREWIPQRPGTGWGEGGTLDLDDNGWIKSLDGDQYAETPLIDGQTCRPDGEYTVLYDGEGTIELGSVNITSTQNGRITFTYPASQTGGIWLRIKRVNPDNYIRNIRVLMPGTENTYQDHPFYPPLIETWGKYKVIRYMDWLSTNNNPTVTWEQRTTPEKHTQASNGIAWEYVIQYSNTINADPWICIPHLADDNYVRQCAQLLKNTLHEDAKIYVEYSNEVWNSQFGQSTYAQEEGVRLGLAPSSSPWEAKAPYYIRRSMEIFQIFAEEFGSTDRLVRVIAWQTGQTGQIDQMMNYDYQLINGEGQTTLVGKKGKDLTDAIASAPYFGGYLGGEKEWVNNHTVDDILIACENHIQEVMNTVDQQVKQADSYGKIFLAYEAGQHLCGTGGNENDQDMTDKFIAANRHPRMQELYHNYLERWKASGARTMCIFSSIGTPSKWGSWSIIESYCDDTLQRPKYMAIREFSENNTPAWWLQPTPPAAEVGNPIINFDADNITSNLPILRDYQIINEKEVIPFSTEESAKLFDGGNNTQATIYGGFLHVDPVNPLRKPNIEKNKGITMYIDAGNGGYSEGTGIFIWKKEQFLEPANTISKLSVNIAGITGKARFIIKNAGKYYVSEYLITQAGEYELTECDNSEIPSKRWVEFTPDPEAFTLPDIFTGFKPVELNDITEVGIWMTSKRDSWGHNFTLNSFTAYTKPSPYGNHQQLTNLITECQTLLQTLMNENRIGEGNTCYPETAKITFEEEIATAQEIDKNQEATQTELDKAKQQLEQAKQTFLESEIQVSYTPLEEAIKTSENLYNTTGGGTLYPEEARETFLNEINKAKEIYAQPYLTETQITEAVEKLQQATQQYENTRYNTIEETQYDTYIYPNPAKEKLFIKTEEPILSTRITTLNGITIKKEENKKQIDISQLQQGLYIIHIITNKNTTTHIIKKE